MTTGRGPSGGNGTRLLTACAAAAALVGMLLATVSGRAPSANAATSGSPGYWLVASDGGLYNFGSPYDGSERGVKLGGPVVGMAATPTGLGYWMAAADGGVFSFGDAAFYGSMGGKPLNRPVVGMASTPTGKGYWLVASDGGIFSFGDATFYGSMGGKPLNAPVVGMSSDPDTGGYWLVASDGGVFTFNSSFHGSEGGKKLNQPITGMASIGDGGYWMVARDGGIFTFGNAPFLGSTGSDQLPAPIVGMAATPFGYPFPPGATGYDVSRNSCGNLPPARTFNIAEITSGGPGGLSASSNPNPCYQQEAAWGGPDFSPYIWMNSPPSSTPQTLSGPAGDCSPSDAVCQGYNYGWNWSVYWVRYSRSLNVNAPFWWLDVEGSAGDGNWSSSTTANAAVVRGAVAGITAAGAEVGVYSTYYQWPRVVGSLTFPNIPLWAAGAGSLSGPFPSAMSFCTDPGQVFAGGVVTLVQYGYPQASPYYDPDYACR